jgi:hypothetical protein
MARLKFGGRAAKPLCRLAQEYPDAAITKNGRGHWKFTFPNGRTVVVPSTFFDGPMTRALLAQLRRAARDETK